MDGIMVANRQTLRYILDYLGGPSVIIRVPKGRRERQERVEVRVV